MTTAVTGARDQDRPDPLINVAFSYAGLRALGVDQDLCDGFSTAFVQGSSHPDRARINGDVNQDAPTHWDWGGSEETQVHVALLIFARDEASVKQHTERYLEEARAHGLELVTAEPLDAGTLPGRKEHFGFRDGIAQPVVRGSGDTSVEQNTIAAGEIFLGHRDGYGNVAVAPTSERGFRFGHNGSYMVLRQLEQDVAAFWKSCDEQGKAFELNAEAFASKLVGRWPSGRPLVRFPERDPMPNEDDNDDAFTYFESGVDNDRYGARCPFAAHIRRANPRDWVLGASAEESLRLSNLHRIIRRGRPYGPALAESMRAGDLLSRAQAEAAGTGEKRGLQFICFNANLERQFEFIQQQWCKNPKFAGQVSDADPILGARCPVQELGLSDQGMTLQSGINSGAYQRITNLTPFVHVKGSAYLFMPSVSALRLLPEVVEAAAEPEEAARIEALEQVPDDEQLHIDNLIANVRTMLKRQYVGKQTLRDAHPKMHGLVSARLEISQTLPPELRTPLFEPGKHYAAWVRLSNQNHVPAPDTRPDTCGLALKLQGVKAVKLLDGEEGDEHHDFIFLSTPRFVTRDVAGFDELLNALVNKQLSSKLKSLPAFYSHWRSLQQHTSPLEITYFSVVPSLVGKVAVKLRLEPMDETRMSLHTGLGRNYLRERLEQQLAEKDHCFQLSVQRYRDQRSTPIEDPTVVWPTEYEPVAVLRIVKQQGFNTDEQREQGENMAFNPFRCLPEHRPLGGINRARRQVYQ
ncbi:MAG TPA: Dyp-type peroxidase, partial [Polyangiales bacterium]